MLLINTHTGKVNAELVVRALQSYTCITHSVRVLPCEDSMGMIDVSQTIRACASERLEHYQHLLFTGPSVYWSAMPSCSTAGSLNALGYVLKERSLLKHTWLPSSTHTGSKRNWVVFHCCYSYIFNRFRKTGSKLQYGWLELLFFLFGTVKCKWKIWFK